MQWAAAVFPSCSLIHIHIRFCAIPKAAKVASNIDEVWAWVLDGVGVGAGAPCYTFFFSCV